MKILVLCLFLPIASFAQGTFLFTWHGQSNYFQASFILTDAEMQPGAPFSSAEFTNSLQVDSLSGFRYDAKNDESLFAGGANPWGWRITLVDFDHGMEIIAGGFEPPAMGGFINEKPISGNQLYFDTGFWTYAEIPEPPVASLAVAGAVCFAIRRGRAGVNRPSRNRLQL
jgi:hypothetical protein